MPATGPGSSAEALRRLQRRNAVRMGLILAAVAAGVFVVYILQMVRALS